VLAECGQNYGLPVLLYGNYAISVSSAGHPLLTRVNAVSDSNRIVGEGSAEFQLSSARQGALYSGAWAPRFPIRSAK